MLPPKGTADYGRLVSFPEMRGITPSKPLAGGKSWSSIDLDIEIGTAMLLCRADVTSIKAAVTDIHTLGNATRPF